MPKRKKKKAAPRPRSKFKGVLRLLLVVSLLLAIAYVKYLVVEKIQFRKFRATSVITSRPFAIRPETPVAGSQLGKRLLRLGYKPVESEPENIGEFRSRPDELLIYARNVALPAPYSQRAQLVRLTVRNDVVKELNDAKYQQPLEQLILEPEVLAPFSNASSRASSPKALEDFPPHLREALLSIEDERFFSHVGVDLFAIGRAIFVNLREGRIVQGASTLTQQLAKNLFLSRERTYERKIREIITAIVLETIYTKEQILELYLNEVFLGQEGNVAVHGFAEAGSSFFGKQIEDLNLLESALLAGLVKAPSSYSPRRNLAKARARAELVLQKMKERGVITEKEYRESLTAKLRIRPPARSRRKAPYFIDYVREQVTEDFDASMFRDTPLVVTTSLDSVYQECAEAAVASGLQELEKRYKRLQNAKQPLQAALLSVVPSGGEVRAWVGGRDYRKNQFDRVSLAKRQPGSAFKPFVYLTAIDKRLNNYRVARTTSLLEDEPLELTVPGTGVWSPQNYKKGYRGLVTVREALTYSLNIPTVQLALKVGVDSIHRTASLAGLPETLPKVPALALGAGEVTMLALVRAYTGIASGGYLSEVTPVRSITASGDPDALFQAEMNEIRFSSPEATYVLTDMLRSVVESGTARSIRRLGYERPAAGKTGTTNDTRDAWFVGFSPTLLTGVWVGFDDNSSTKLTGGAAAAPIWTAYMKCVSPMEPELDFVPPSGVVFRKIDLNTGLLASPGCIEPQYATEVFVEGTEPITPCKEYYRNPDFGSEEWLEDAEKTLQPPPKPKRRGFWDSLFS